LYDVALAEELAQSGLAIAIRSQAVKYEFIFRAESALLAAEYRDLANAESHLARCNEILAEGEDWRGVRGRLALAEAVVAAGRGRHDQADAEFTLALEVFRSMSLPWDEAETFELWARFGRRFHRGAGRRAFIADKLGEARAVYVHIGAGQPWLDRLEAEAGRLAAEGSHVKSEPLPDGLTAREAEVLRFIARGQSNRQIADELVLSIRTVERHIANIYEKAGVHTKSQATAYAFSRTLN
jgi:ATP/maltotriose-dependent transcriptional regulator MalT